MEQLIKIKNLTFKYNGYLVLDQVSLEVTKGEFIGLIGPNGSGKSTLMKLLVGQLTPDSGEINLFNTPVEEFDKWHLIGYISQFAREFNKSFPATVREVVGANLYKRMGFIKFLKAEHEEQIDQVLRWVGMFEYKNTPIGNLSGGQQQRMLLARTLITDPELILLDEPLIGVDNRAQKDFYYLLNKLNLELGITIVMVSHDIDMISNQANKIICIGNKKVFTYNVEEFDINCYLQDIKGDNKFEFESSDRVVK